MTMHIGEVLSAVCVLAPFVGLAVSYKASEAGAAPAALRKPWPFFRARLPVLTGFTFIEKGSLCHVTDDLAAKVFPPPFYASTRWRPRTNRIIA